MVELRLYRVLRCVVERFEDLSHLSSGPEMHPEAGQSTARGQADHAGTHTHTQMSNRREHQHGIPAAGERRWRSSPKATCVERLTTFQPGVEILKVIGELLVLSKLHHVVEVLHVLDDSIQLEKHQMRRL